MKDEMKKNHPWSPDIQPPQALHFDIDHNYAAQHIQSSAKLWKKGSKRRINGLQLRLIPCLGSPRALALLDSQKQNCVLKAAKQQYFTNQHIIRLKNSHILNLDVKAEKMVTLRRYLMSCAPRTEVLQRLFVAVDKSWKGGTFTLITARPYVQEAMRALNNTLNVSMNMVLKRQKSGSLILD
jgi:hypothetical protein